MNLAKVKQLISTGDKRLMLLGFNLNEGLGENKNKVLSNFYNTYILRDKKVMIGKNYRIFKAISKQIFEDIDYSFLISLYNLKKITYAYPPRKEDRACKRLETTFKYLNEKITNQDKSFLYFSKR